MKFLTKQALQDKIDSITIPLQLEIERQERIIRLVEQIYHIDLHNKTVDEVLIALFQNKNALFWDTYERGQNKGIEISLCALTDNKIISKAYADELAQKSKEYGHELFVESKENINKRIVDKWREEYDKVRLS